MAKSSTKKAARLAQKGKGQRIRFQGGTVFPLAVALTLILGLALIVYSRQTLPAVDESISEKYSSTPSKSSSRIEISSSLARDGCW